MLIAAARRRVAALRQPGPAARIARALWITWAVLVWNVVFDRVIVVAGRAYIAAARTAADANPSGRLPNMDDWMRPAVTRGLWIATASGAAILLIGFAALHVARTGGQIPASRDEIAASRRRGSEPPRMTPCA